MFDTSDILALLAVLASWGAVGATFVQKRRHTKAEQWLRDSAQYDLIAAADYADAYALRGVEQPGTQAVRTLHPGFDFTMGGKYEDRPLHDTDNVMYAPWPQEAVESLAAYQESGTLQPYTCDVDRAHGHLVPEPEWLRCRVCAYAQRWALRYHADGSWRRDKERLVGVFRRQPAPARRRSPWIEFARRRLGLFLTTAPGRARATRSREPRDDDQAGPATPV